MNIVSAVILGATVGAVVARQLLQHGPPVWLIFLAGAVRWPAGPRDYAPACGPESTIAGGDWYVPLQPGSENFYASGGSNS